MFRISIPNLHHNLVSPPGLEPRTFTLEVYKYLFSAPPYGEGTKRATVNALPLSYDDIYVRENKSKRAPVV